jgi:hypothetical protein
MQLRISDGGINLGISCPQHLQDAALEASALLRKLCDSQCNSVTDTEQSQVSGTVTLPFNCRAFISWLHLSVALTECCKCTTQKLPHLPRSHVELMDALEVTKPRR